MGHQMHGAGLVPALGVDADVEDGVGDHPQQELQIGQLIERVAVPVSGRDHHVLGVAGPALHERPRPQHRAQHRGVPVGVGQLQIMAGRALVDGQAFQGPVVVFPQEGLRLLGAPVLGDGRELVEGGQVAIERSGRIAIGHGHPALELRREHQLHRLGGRGDDGVGGHEGDGRIELGLGDLDQGLRRRPVGIDHLQGRGDGRLLGLGSGVVGRRRRSGAASQDLAGEHVHPRPHLGQRPLGVGLDLGPGQIAVEGEAQLGVIELRTQPPLAGGLGRQRAVDPGLMFGDRGARLVRRDAQGRAAVGVESGVLGQDQVDQTDEPAVLPGIGLGMDLRDAGRDQGGAHLGEEGGQGREPRRGRDQPLLDRGEVAGHQAIEGRSGQGLMDQRVPEMGRQHVVRPDFAGQAVAQNRTVHLPLAGQVVGGDRRKPRQESGGGLALGAPALGRQVVEPVVEPVIPPLGRRDRAEPQAGLQPVRGQGVEG